jgi:hypothetical protein
MGNPWMLTPKPGDGPLPSPAKEFPDAFQASAPNSTDPLNRGPVGLILQRKITNN